MSSLVSVIIPVYNSGRYLKESIDSVLNQSYVNLEIVIVNDGSTDNSWDILYRNYSAEKKIKLLTTLNMGQSAACNFGYLHSTGEYIKFIDSDDIINPVFIEDQMNLIQGSKTMISSASWGRFYNDDLSTFNLNSESVWRDMKPIDWIVDALESRSNMLQCALWLIPRDILLQSGLWNESLALNNDFDFFVRVLLAAKEIKYSERSVLYYRSGIINSLSQTKSKEAFISAVNSNLYGTQHILNHEDSGRTRKACAINLRGLIFQIYPQYPALAKRAQSKIEELGGIDMNYAARPLTQFLSKIFGWKSIRWVSYYIVQKIRKKRSQYFS